MDKLQEAFAAIGAVLGDDGRPVVEMQGADSTSCGVWRDALREVDEELVVWSRTFKRTHGIPREAANVDLGDQDEDDSSARDESSPDPDEDFDEMN